MGTSDPAAPGPGPSGPEHLAALISGVAAALGRKPDEAWYGYEAVLLPEGSGLRICLPGEGLVAHLRPLSDTRWQGDLWLSRLPDDRALANLALHILETSAPSVTVVVDVERDDDDPHRLESFGYAMSLLAELMEAAQEQWLAVLHSRCPGLRIERAGGACPFQAFGTWHGYEVYFRYRRGTARLAVGEDAVDAPLWGASKRHGEHLAGVLGDAEFVDLFLELARALRRQPFRYEFPDRGAPGVTSPHNVWAHTLPEALAELAASAPSAQYVPEPIRLDTRPFPDVEPDFAVLDGPDPVPGQKDAPIQPPDTDAGRR